MAPRAKPKPKVRQTQLDFQPGEDLSFTTQPQSTTRARAPPDEGSAKLGIRRAYVDSKKHEDGEGAIYDSGESVDSEEEAEPELGVEKGSDAPQRDDQEGSGEEGSEEEVQRSSTKGKRRAVVLSSDSDDDGHDEPPLAPSSRSAPRQDIIVINAEDWGSPVSETEFSSPVKPASSAAPIARPIRASTSQPPIKQKKRAIVESEEEEASPARKRASASPAPVKKASKSKRKERERARLEEMLDDEASESSGSDERQFRPRLSAKGTAEARRKQQRKAAVVADSEDESDEEPVKPSRKGTEKAVEKKEGGKGKGKGKAKAITLSDSESDSDSEEDLPNVRDIRTIAKPSPSKKKRARASSSSPPPTRPSTFSLKKRKTSRRHRSSPDPDENDSEGLADSDDHGFIVDEDSLIGSPDSSEVEQRSKSKGKAKSNGKTKEKRKEATKIASSESSEFTDEDDLSLSGKETLQPNRLRTIASPSKGGRFAALREARAQKEQEKHRHVDQRRRLVIDSDDEVHSDSPGPSSSKHQARAPRPTYLGAPESSASDGESSEEASEGVGEGGWERKEDDSDLDRDEEGFIVDEDDDDEEGLRLVAEFRDKVQTQAQGLMYFLKTYLQWLVHLIVCPQVDWLDEDKAFKAAYDQINDNLRGLTQSLIGSTAWKVPFKTALDERPYFSVEDLVGPDRNSACDACTMGKARHSTILGTLYGPIYDRRTFKRPVEVDSESSSDSEDSDAAERRRKAAKKRAAKADAKDAEELTFYLGSSCAGRSQVYSELTHWAFSTHERMVTMLKDVKKNFPRPDLRMKSSAERKKIMREIESRDRAEADRCATELDREGFIAKFAKQLEEEIASARNNFATNKS